MSREEFWAMEKEMMAEMQKVAQKHGLLGLEFDDHFHFWLEEHTEIEE